MRTVTRGALLALLALSAGCSLSIDPESVDPPATMGTTKPSLSLTAVQGGAAATDSFDVTSLGKGTLARPTVTVTAGASWLGASVSGSAAPYRVNVTATPLAGGVHAGTLSITAPGASNARTVTVSFTVQSQPVIVLTSSSFMEPNLLMTIDAVESIATTTPQTRDVYVENGGAAPQSNLAAPTTPIPVTHVSGAGGWLSASLSGTSAPYTLTVSALHGNLPAGTYTATVDVACPGATNTPRQILVTLRVAPPPSIAISDPELAFSTFVNEFASPRFVEVTNAGGGTLGLGTPVPSYVNGSGWLMVTAPPGVLTAPITLSVSVVPRPIGTYLATVTVPSTIPGIASRSFTVRYVVDNKPKAAITPTSLTFSAVENGAAPPARTVAIYNAGGYSLAPATLQTYYDAAGEGWLDPTIAGTLITVRPVVAGRTPGEYGARVKIVSAGSEVDPELVVTLTVTPQPTLQLSRSSVSLASVQGSSFEPVEVVTATSSTGGVLAKPDDPNLSITYLSGDGWLSATIPEASAPYGIQLKATPSPVSGALAAGTYTAIVLVNSQGALATPKAVTVVFTVAPPPAIGLACGGTPCPASLPDFTATQRVPGFPSPAIAPQAVDVSNSGGGTLGTVTTSVAYGPGPTGWLSVVPTTTTAPATVSVQPTVTPISGDLTPGTYTATVTIASSTGGVASRTLNVRLVVLAPPTIALGAPGAFSAFQAVQLGPDPQAQTLQLGNSGTGTLAAPTATLLYDPGPAGWTGAAVTASVTGASEPYTLSVQPHLAGLPPGGPYTAKVRLTSTGAINSPLDVPVSFTVIQAPSLVFSPTSLSSTVTEGSSPPALHVTVTNGGGSDLSFPTAAVSYVSGPASGWLAPPVVGGSLNSYDLAIQPTIGGFAPGTYVADVAVSSTGASNTGATVRVTLTIVAKPAMKLVTTPGGPAITSVTFPTVVQGTSSPPLQNVFVENSGGSLTPLLLTTTTITYDQGTPGWLAAPILGASAPFTIPVTATLGSLTAGTYRATVRVESSTASNNPQSFTVTLVVDPPPAIAFSPAGSNALSFTKAQGVVNPASQDVVVVNGGGGTLQLPDAGPARITYVSGAATGWLSASVAGANAPYTVTVSPSVAGLAPGTYTANIALAAAGAANSGQASATISVAFTVLKAPTILLTPTTLAFSATKGLADPATQTFDVANTGDAGAGALADPVVVVSYVSGSGWLSAPDTCSGAPCTITVAATSTPVAAGSYQARVRVSSANAINSPQEVTVTFAVAAQPVIAPSPTALTFTANEGGATPAAQHVTVTNGGGGALAAPTATPSVAWLDATVTGAAAPYDVSIQPNQVLTPGDHTATVDLTSAGAANSGQPSARISVTYTVIQKPAIQLVPAGPIAFSATQGGSSPAYQDVEIRNSGGGTLPLPTASVDAGASSWLGVTVTGTGAPYTLRLQPTLGALVAGTYNATITVSAAGVSNPNQTLAVVFTVAAPPQLRLDKSALTFSATAGDPTPVTTQTVTIDNVGGGTISPTTTLSYGSGAGWLEAPAPAVSGGPGVFTLKVQPNVSGLSPGSYAATILVWSAGASNAPQPITVTFNVAAPPALRVAPTTLSYVAVEGPTAPAAQSIAVTNIGGGTLAAPSASVTYLTGASGWIGTPTRSGSGNSYTFDVPVLAGFSAGTYTARIDVVSAGASNNPQSVAVTFTVGSPAVPILTLSPTTLAFGTRIGAPLPAEQAVVASNSGTGTLATPTVSIPLPDQAWLQVSSAPAGGAGGPFTFKLRPVTTALAAGTYTTTVTVSSPGASNTATVAVSYDVAGVSGCVGVAAGHAVCGGVVAASSADKLGTPGGHAVKRTLVQAGSAPSLSTGPTSHKISRGTVTSAAARP